MRRLTLLLLVMALRCAFLGGRVLEAQTRRQEVATSGFHGRLYLPEHSGRTTAVLLIGGSEGRLLLADEIAPLLAAQGYAVLGVDYHDGFAGDRKLDLVPIEMFAEAARWLRGSVVQAKRVVVLGDSRGGVADGRA